MLKVLFIIILIIIISVLTTKINKTNEYFTALESIQNISSVYNNRNMKTTKLEITNDASLNNINITGELRIKNKYVINIDNSGNLEIYDISNNVKNIKLWNSSDFLKSGAKNIKLLEPALCDSSGRYCIFPRRYYNYDIDMASSASPKPAYGLNPDGHMEFIVYDTDKNGNNTNVWDPVIKNLYLTHGFADGYKTRRAESAWNRESFNSIYKNFHNTWKTTDGDTIPILFRDASFTTAQAWDSVRFGKQAYNFDKNPEQSSSNNPYVNQSNYVGTRANLT